MYKQSYKFNMNWIFSCTSQLLSNKDSSRVITVRRKKKKKVIFPTMWKKTVPVMQFHLIKVFIHWKLKESSSQVTKQAHTTTTTLCCLWILNNASNPKHWKNYDPTKRLLEKEIASCFFLFSFFFSLGLRSFHPFHFTSSRFSAAMTRTTDYWHLQNEGCISHNHRTRRWR